MSLSDLKPSDVPNRYWNIINPWQTQSEVDSQIKTLDRLVARGVAIPRPPEDAFYYFEYWAPHGQPLDGGDCGCGSVFCPTGT
jgi:hypothetical protein